MYIYKIPSLCHQYILFLWKHTFLQVRTFNKNLYLFIYIFIKVYIEYYFVLVLGVQHSG